MGSVLFGPQMSSDVSHNRMFYWKPSKMWALLGCICLVLEFRLGRVTPAFSVELQLLRPRFSTAVSLHKISTRVEVYAKQSFTKEIVGGVLGAVLLLALIAAVLYKAGFFKSKYNQMVQEAGEDADGDAGDNADAPPATE
ncbi:integrin alpha-X-like [Arapaima gigas]